MGTSPDKSLAPPLKNSILNVGRGLTIALLAAAAACTPKESPDTSATHYTGTSESAGGSSTGHATVTSSSSSGTTESTESTTTVSTTTSSTTTASTTESSMGSDSTTEDCGFLDCYDVGQGPVLDCNTYAQDCEDGEDGEAQKCVPFNYEGGSSPDGTKCVKVTGNKGQNEICQIDEEGSDDCAEGLFCWNSESSSTEGVCVTLCAGNLQIPVCPEETTCIQSVRGQLDVCWQKCDPDVPDTCPGEQECVETDGVCY